MSRVGPGDPPQGRRALTMPTHWGHIQHLLSRRNKRQPGAGSSEKTKVIQPPPQRCLRARQLYLLIPQW